jgi:membrane protein
MTATAAHQSDEAQERLGVVGFLKELYRRIYDDRVLEISAGVAFYVLLAMFPAVAVAVSIFGLFENLNDVNSMLSRLSALLPGGFIDIVSEQIRRTVAKGHEALGWAALFGFLLSLWSANAGIKSLFDALNIVLKKQEKRSFLVLNGISLLFTIALIAVFGLAAGFLIWVTSWLPFDNPLIAWPVAAIGVAALWTGLAFAIALLYRFGPSANDIRWHWITWGSASTAVAWLCFSALFSWYAANFGSFDKTYGSLGAAVGFMTWIWLSTVVILLGEETNEILNMRQECRQGPLQAN